MEESEDWSLLKYFPLFSAVIIFLGITRLVFFYGAFEINIIGYLDFSEIITSFSDIIIILVIAWAVPFIHYFLQRKRMTPERFKEFILILKNDKFSRRFAEYWKFYKGDFFESFLGTLFMFLGLKFVWSLPLIYGLYFIAFFPCYFIWIIFNNEVERKHAEFQSNREIRFLFKYFIYCLILFVFIFFKAYQQVSQIKENKIYNGTVITLDSGSLISDSTNYYIGNTHNYVYFYHEKGKYCDVIPMSRVKMISARIKDL